MLSKILISVSVAWQNIKANPLHTILSTLGIVIGVAALVAILSLADGMEEFARDQISRTTSLEAVMVESKTSERVDNIWVRIEDYPVIGLDQLDEMRRAVPDAERIRASVSGSAILKAPSSDERVGVSYHAVVDSTDRNRLSERLWKGNLLEEGDSNKVVISKSVADRLSGDNPPEDLIGARLMMDEKEVEVCGIFDFEDSRQLLVAVPLGLLDKDDLRQNPPSVVAVASSVEEVPQVEEQLKAWLDEEFEQGAEGFRVFSNQMRVDQARQGILLFKLVMGLITGISVLVGGIGVMNVLLVSVTERTMEIGIRKATGAKRKDIILQFLSESVTVTALGSLLGLVVGILFSLAAVPIVKYVVDIPFHVAFTGSTLVVIGIIALVVGVVFGTYPAMRAARLTPVEAIRRE